MKDKYFRILYFDGNNSEDEVNSISLETLQDVNLTFKDLKNYHNIFQD